MDFTECSPQALPIDLLLEADPCQQSIDSYLSDSWCFVAKKADEIVAACIVKPIEEHVAEIFNVAVYPHSQQQGIGSQLLSYVLTKLTDKELARVELSTGTFGHQLTYYQRHGFRVDKVVKDHFLDNYPEAIFENGIQHKDMLRLYLNLDNER